MNPEINVQDNYVTIALHFDEATVVTAMQTARALWSAATGAEPLTFTTRAGMITDGYVDGECVYRFRVDISPV